MSLEKNELPLTALLSVVPVILLFATDFNLMMLQLVDMSHFAFAVLIAQLICWVAFRFGDICPGQRGRLTVVNLCWLGFWVAWLWLSTQAYPSDIWLFLLNISGIVLTLASASQAKIAEKRKLPLLLALFAAIFGIFCYFVLLWAQSAEQAMGYNLISQTFTGVILAYLALVISRNRLQGFIALLPVIFNVVLLCNAVAILGWLAVLHFVYTQPLAANVAIYFLLHLLLAVIFIYPILSRSKLTYSPLLLALCISLSLPFLL